MLILREDNYRFWGRRKMGDKKERKPPHTICKSLDDIRRVALKIRPRYSQRQINRRRPNLTPHPPRRTPRLGPRAAVTRFRRTVIGRRHAGVAASRHVLPPAERHAAGRDPLQRLRVAVPGADDPRPDALPARGPRAVAYQAPAETFPAGALVVGRGWAPARRGVHCGG